MSTRGRFLRHAHVGITITITPIRALCITPRRRREYGATEICMQKIRITQIGSR